VAALAALTACGGGGGSSNSKAAAPAADKVAATKVVLKPADFPSGWTAQAHAVGPNQAATVRQLGECLGIGDPATHTSADVNSPDFSKSQGTTAASEARFVQTDAQASADLAGFQGPKATDCLKTALESISKERLPSGLTPSELTVQQLQFPTLKDGTAAHQASFTIPVAGTNVPVYVDFIVFRAGRAEVTLATTNLGSPFDPKLEQDLAKKMADRAS
jgi:hypothetical protein